MISNTSSICRRLWRAGVAFWLVFASAGAHMAAAAEKAVAEVKFSIDHGFYEAPFALDITTKIAGAKIYFTMNGIEPAESNAELYRGPIQITTTTIIRAMAWKDGAASQTATRTYIFPREVLKQTGAGFPQSWGTNNGKAVPAYYKLPTEILHDAQFQQELAPALKSIPTISLILEPRDLFDSGTGIYSNPKESGPDWERPASLEVIFPDGRKGFQVNCGLRIQGGWNRRPEESPKHAFRVVFKKKYGPGKLKLPLFPEPGAREFDTLILRAGCNNTWLHWSAEERRRGDYIRDQWMRDTLREMDHVSARGYFVHLYLNGLYWGLYNLCERPSGAFVAANFGGKPGDYDVRNGDHILEGDGEAWKKLMQLVNSGVKGEREFAALRAQADVSELIDYLIANFYGANADWDHASNWYAARRRDDSGKWQFFVWDGERTLENIEANSMAFDDDQSPPRLFHKLRENSEFRRMFAERARHHLTDDGPLTPSRAAARYEKWSKTIQSAIIAEAARWGNYRCDIHQYKTGPYELYTPREHWKPEIERLLKDYFPKRTQVVIKQFEEAGLMEKEK
jgi:hypothetical protein